MYSVLIILSIPYSQNARINTALEKIINRYVIIIMIIIVSNDSNNKSSMNIKFEKYYVQSHTYMNEVNRLSE